MQWTVPKHFRSQRLSTTARINSFAKNGVEESREAKRNQANIVVLGLGDRFSDLQTNLDLFSPESQLIFTSRSLHSPHQPPSSYRLFSSSLYSHLKFCSNSWSLVLILCSGWRLLAEAVVNVAILRFNVSWFSFVAFTARATYCEWVSFYFYFYFAVGNVLI